MGKSPYTFKLPTEMPFNCLIIRAFVRGVIKQSCRPSLPKKELNLHFPFYNQVV